MKTISNILNNGVQNNTVSNNTIFEKLKVDDINLPKDYKEELAEIKEDIDAIIKKMDLGDFKYKGSFSDRCLFGLDSSSRYDWDIRYDMKYLNVHDLTFGSIASYGGFEMNDEAFKFYKSVGIILSQEKELNKIKEKFAEIQEVLERHYNEKRK